MPLTPIKTAGAPRAIGPYSPAVVVPSGKMVFVSGQIALDPRSEELIEGDAAAQTERIFMSIRALLEAAGANLTQVVRTTVYLTDLGDFDAMNEVYGRFLVRMPPARSTIGVAALPRGARVEIDVIAVLA